MTLWQQALIVFGLVQIVFGYYEYRASPSIITVIPKLFQFKYFVPSLAITIFYLILIAGIVPLLRSFSNWFFNV